MIRRTYQEDFGRSAARAGLPPEFTPHALRHCYASIALAGGIPITEVSRWLGHKGIEVTHQIYGHLVPCLLGPGPDRIRRCPPAAVNSKPARNPVLIPRGLPGR